MFDPKRIMKPETLARRAVEAEADRKAHNDYTIFTFRRRYENDLREHDHQYAHEVWGELLLQHFGYDIDGRE